MSLSFLKILKKTNARTTEFDNFLTLDEKLKRQTQIHQQNSMELKEFGISLGNHLGDKADLNDEFFDLENMNKQPEKVTKNRIRKKLMKDKFIEWSTWTTPHGISNFVRMESIFLKALWIVCLLASLSYCVYAIINIIIGYLAYDVLIQQQILTSAPIDFPAVTVCNLFPFDQRSASTYLNSVLFKNNLSYVTNFTLININPKLINSLFKSSIIGNTNLSTDSLKKYGFDINYMLLTCYFNGIPCNTSDFVWRYDYDHTNCYTFNSGYDQNGNKVPIKQINEAGCDKSLILELFLGDDAVQSNFIPNSGARVVIHNQTITPIIPSEGIDIATGFQTNIAVRRSFLSRLDSPYSDCIKDSRSPGSFDSVFYRAIFENLNMPTYRQKMCLRLCLQDYIKTYCTCLDGRLPNIYNISVPICQTISDLQCVKQSTARFYNDRSASACKDCPQECDSVIYSQTTSNSRYPSNYYLTYLRAKTNIVSKYAPQYTASSVSDGQITKSNVILNVYYEDLATTYTSETPAIDSNDLLGNIGGNLGLFIGMSLLSFMEIIELGVEFLFIWIRTPSNIK